MFFGWKTNILFLFLFFFFFFLFFFFFRVILFLWNIYIKYSNSNTLEDLHASRTTTNHATLDSLHSKRSTLTGSSGLVSIHSMSELQNELSSTNCFVAVCFTATFQGDTQEDSRLLTNMALSFTNQMTFLSVHVSSGGETEEVYVARELGVTQFPSIIIYDNQQSIETPRWFFDSIDNAHHELTQYFKTSVSKEEEDEDDEQKKEQVKEQQQKQQQKEELKEQQHKEEEDKKQAEEVKEVKEEVKKKETKKDAKDDKVKKVPRAPSSAASTTTTLPSPSSPLPSSSAKSNQQQQPDLVPTPTPTITSSTSNTSTTSTTTKTTEYSPSQLFDIAIQNVTKDPHVQKLIEIIGISTCSVTEAYYLLYEKQNKNFTTEKHLVDIAKAVDHKYMRTETTTPLGYTLPIQKILSLEIRLLGKMNESTKTAIKQEPVLRDMQDMVKEGLLTDKDVLGFEAQLKSGVAPSDVAHAVQTLLRHAAQLQRDEFQLNKMRETNVRFNQLYESKDIQDNLWRLNWSNKHAVLKRYTGLRVALQDEIVGLQIVKGMLTLREKFNT